LPPRGRAADQADEMALLLHPGLAVPCVATTARLSPGSGGKW
jgi:hypothetical protein